MSDKNTKKAESKPAIVKKPHISDRPNARLRKKPNYKSFRLHKRIKHHGPKLPSWSVLVKKSLLLMRANWRQIVAFSIVYGILNMIFVRGFDGTVDVSELKQSLSDLFGVDYTPLITGFTIFGLLTESTLQAPSETAQIYQSFLLVFASLSIIWLYRQQQAGNKVSMKMAFYRGMYPFVPFVLVLTVIGLQMLPGIIGNFVYLAVVEGGFAVNAAEQFVWLLLYISMLLLSLYMVSGSFIALYVVTLPDMTPMSALAETRALVRFRRSALLGRALALFLVIVMFFVVLILPIIFFAPALADWIFFISTVLAIPFVHGYVFSLYRELL